MSPHVRRPVLAAASLVAVYALSTTSATAAVSPSSLPVPGGTSQALLVGNGCDVVRFYVAFNPSMNKPRGHQDAPDHWSWAAGC
jgi:hypothetical protein